MPLIPKDYFIHPLNIKLYLAGTFGEIRSNHFHSGIDIKTNQREGYPVYAVADGYVSRLRVQIGGFGNAVYINHPNGITSVYAHLQKFNERIFFSVNKYQYLNKSFATDFQLTPIEIPVKKGDIIAWSGNSGSSAGPHLHFELRDSKTEHTINPLALGIKIDDHIKPTINGFYIYNLNDGPFSEFTKKQYFQTTGSSGNYTLNKVSIVNVSGKIGLGIMAYDQLNGSDNKNGHYSTTILLDGEKIFETVIDRFSFDDTRSINAFIDYPTKLTSGRVIQKGFKPPGARPSFYKYLTQNGIIELTDDKIHDIKYILKDIEGNQSVLNLKIKAAPGTSQTFSPKGQLLDYRLEHNLKYDGVFMNFPKGIFYDDVDLMLNKTAKTANSLSPIFHIHNKLTPLHQAFELQIKIDSSLYNLKDKLVIVNENGASQGGEISNDYIKAFPKVLGKFYLKADTIAPVIIPVNVKEGANLAQQKRLSFKISDNLSGIKSFNGYINDEWVVMEYDPRYRSLIHDFDQRTGFGKHNFKLVVTDMKNNTKTYNINFFR